MRGSFKDRDARQKLIREILDDPSQQITNQRTLLAVLMKRGLKQVKQSTISRDLQELGVVKVSGKYRINAVVTHETSKDIREIIEMVKSFEPAGSNLLILHTPQGFAPGVAGALDKAGWEEILGTLSGDDTLFIATAGRREQLAVEQRLAELTGRPLRQNARSSDESEDEDEHGAKREPKGEI